MNMKTIVLLLFITILGVCGKSSRLTLESISGTWVATYPGPMFNIFLPPGSQRNNTVLCREAASPKCEAVLPDVTEIFFIDAETRTFNTVLIGYPMATSMEISAALYPECAAEELPISAGTFEGKGELISYENDKLAHTLDGYDSCILWHVFMEDGDIKAKVRQTADITMPFTNLPSRTPTYCEDLDLIPPNHLDDYIDEDLECYVELAFAIQQLIVSFQTNLEAKCMAGPCLGLMGWDGW